MVDELREQVRRLEDQLQRCAIYAAELEGRLRHLYREMGYDEKSINEHAGMWRAKRDEV